jgi:hypothetical protein
LGAGMTLPDLATRSRGIYQHDAAHDLASVRQNVVGQIGQGTAHGADVVHQNILSTDLDCTGEFGWGNKPLHGVGAGVIGLIPLDYVYVITGHASGTAFEAVPRAP